MGKYTAILVFCVLCLWLICSQLLPAATLEPKIGARPLGMSAFAAVADDINAICWNPAGLSLLQSQEAATSYAPVYGFDEGIKQSYLAYAYPTGRWGTAGANLSYLAYGDMGWRDDSGADLGIFSRRDYSIYASYGMRVINSLSLGAALGTTSIKMNSIGDSATGFGFDLGALYTIASRASLGLCLENIGGVSASDREIARQKVRAGAAFSVLDRPDMGLVAALDVDGEQGRLDTLYSGMEWTAFSPSSFFVKRKLQERHVKLLRYGEMADLAEGLPEPESKASLCIRGGIKKRLVEDKSLALSGGVCVKYLLIPNSLTMRIEHAFGWHPYLKTTHRFSLGLEMGGVQYN